MIRIVPLAFLSTLLAVTLSSGQATPAPSHPPLRVGIVGLVHGHVHGFLGASLHSPEIRDRRRRRARPSSAGAGCNPIWFRPLSALCRSGRDAAERTSAGRSGLHQHLRPPPRGGNLRPAWRPRHDGKTASGQPRRRAGHREGGARRQNSSAGELRNFLVPQQSCRLRPGA